MYIFIELLDIKISNIENNDLFTSLLYKDCCMLTEEDYACVQNIILVQTNWKINKKYNKDKWKEENWFKLVAEQLLLQDIGGILYEKKNTGFYVFKWIGMIYLFYIHRIIFINYLVAS